MPSKRSRADSLGRRLPSEYKRRKRALKGAQHRWGHKWQLEPGRPKPWNQLSLANKLRQLAAAKKGGETTGSLIKEQQRVFWRWYHGACKAQLRGPFRTVVETLERIEAAYLQRYGDDASKDLPWDGFMHHVFTNYVLKPCWTKDPKVIEREMWKQYARFMEADASALSLLLQPLFDYEDEKERRKAFRASSRRARHNQG